MRSARPASRVAGSKPGRTPQDVALDTVIRSLVRRIWHDRAADFVPLTRGGAAPCATKMSEFAAWPRSRTSCLGTRRLPARLLRPPDHGLPGRLGSRPDGAVAADPVRSEPSSQPRPAVGERCDASTAARRALNTPAEGAESPILGVDWAVACSVPASGERPTPETRRNGPDAVASLPRALHSGSRRALVVAEDRWPSSSGTGQRACWSGSSYTGGRRTATEQRSTNRSWPNTVNARSDADHADRAPNRPRA